MKLKLNDPKILVIFGIILLVFFVVGKKTINYISEPPVPKEQWQAQYREQLLSNNIDLKYTQAQPTIDYNTPQLTEVINNMDSNSPEDALKKATKFVLRNVQYDSSNIDANFCYKETATSTYILGFGDCVSMTKLGTALLRGQGIAVRSTGGCVVFTGACDSIMGTIPLHIPKAEIFDGKKRGYLHEWAEVWMPEDGWVLVDFTSGAIYDKGCSDYHFYSYDEGHYKDMCVITDKSFIGECRSL